ncbi:MAG TPA: AzlC family ABC transporter permease [Bacillota bacterium]|nr:AzlC family ABC transporter permease [Bacillota bacterium]
MEGKDECLVSSPIMIQENKKTKLAAGLRAGIPIAVGYIPIAIAFGLLAKSTGIPNYISIMMSVFIFAGASQFVGVNLIALGAGFSEIIFTTFILNLRHFLMSASLYQRVDLEASKVLRILFSYGITDETFSVASLRSESKLSGYFLLALNGLAFLSWNIGTIIGIFLAQGLPTSLKSSMGIALYAMFIALLVPSLGKSKEIMVVSLTAASVHGILHWVPLFKGLSTGWAIIISTVMAALVGSFFFKSEVKDA